MYGLRTDPLVDRDLQNMSDLRTDYGSLVDEKLRTRTDADPNPAWVIFYNNVF